MQPSTQNTHRPQPTCLLHGRAPAPHTQGLVLVQQGGQSVTEASHIHQDLHRTWPPCHGVTSVPAGPTSPTPDSSLVLA